MRRLLASIGVIVLLAGVTVGYATRLGVGPTALSAGSTAVVPCDPDGIELGYRLAWNGHVVIDRVEVRGIADRCVGRRLTAILVVAGTPVELGSVTVRFSRPDDNVVSLVVDADVRPTTADGVHVSIT